MRHGRTFVLVVATILAASCGPRGSVAPAPIAVPESEYKPSRDSGNAFDDYLSLADELLETAPRLCRGISFTPGERKAWTSKLRRTAQRLRTARSRPFTYEYRAYDPFAPNERSLGLRALGRLARWHAEDAAEAGNHPDAADYALDEAVLGVRLAAGDVTSSSLGISLVDEAVDLLARMLPKLSATSLAKLEARLSRPDFGIDPEPVFRFERRQSALVLEHVRALARAEEWDELRAVVGPTTLGKLQEFRLMHAEKREERIREAAGELDIQIGEMGDLAAKPMADRRKITGATRGPLAALHSHLTLGMVAWMRQRDRALTRIRLLTVEAWARRRTLAQGVPPKSKFPIPEINLDPYTGRPFIVRSSGNAYMVYSPGPDLRDDGGSPASDLVLPTGLF